MKKLIYFVIMLLVSNCNYLYSQSGWMQQTSGVSVTLNKIFFVNSQTGWAVGDLGKIIRTTNGGANWVSQISNTCGELVELIGCRKFHRNKAYDFIEIKNQKLK